MQQQMTETSIWKRMGNKYMSTTQMEIVSSPKPVSCSLPLRNYDERMDCNAICCCGCNIDKVEAKVAGGKVCWRCLSRLIIRLAVCSVARSLPHRTYKSSNFPSMRKTMCKHIPRLSFKNQYSIISNTSLESHIYKYVDFYFNRWQLQTKSYLCIHIKFRHSCTLYHIR